MKKLKEKENTRTLKGEVQAKIGDEVPPIPTNLKTLLMEEHKDTIPWIPYHPDPYGSPRKYGRCNSGMLA